MAMVMGRRDRVRVFFAHAFMIALLALILFPFLMIVAISFRPGNFASGELIPDRISLEHWKLALGIPVVQPDGSIRPPPFPVMLWLWNSIKVAAITATGILLLATTSAYAFARLRFRGKGVILNSILILQMFPAVLALVAIYAIFETIGSYVPWLGLNSHGGLVLAYVGMIALHVWTIKGYFETLPYELEEAARVDGATPFQTFRYVVLPMAVPILAVVFILAFIMAIIEYPVASVLLQSEDQLTLAVGSRFYLQEQNYLWGDFAAAAVLSGLPITLVFLAAQRWIISGLTAGGVKG
jgi:maltose/maltodextrin transport system permease protein